MTQQILIANSSETQGKVLQTMLQSGGYDVTLTRNFQEALQTLENRLPQLIILDKHAPEAGAKQMCEQCQNRCPGVPILMSGLDWQPLEIFEFMAYGVTDVIGGLLQTQSVIAHVNYALGLFKTQ